MCFRAFFWALLLSVPCVLAVTVFKCCNDGSVLNENADCVESGRSSSWAPAIYSPVNRGFLPPGTIPSSWTFNTVRKPVCPFGSPLLLRTSPTPNYVSFENGSLWWQNSGSMFHPDTFCVDSTAVLLCSDKVEEAQPPSEGSSTKTRVRKCCGKSGVFSERKLSCVDVPADNEILRNFLQNTVITSGFPSCKDDESFDISGTLDDSHALNIDGTLSVSNGTVISEYCVEKILEKPEDKASVFTCPSKFKTKLDLSYSLYPYALFLSAIFLAITLVASCLLPSTYHVLHWRCQTNHVACLLLGDLLLGTVQITGSSLSPVLCIGIAIAMHFLFLAAFFWLNTMCFNIWWTFRDLRPTSLDIGQETCRLRFYELYAWGGPLLIAGVAAVMDRIPEVTHTTLIKPRFGEARCWFYGDAEILAYFYAPIGILLVLNLTLFLLTARELTCGLWRTEVVKSTTERATLSRVCLKLVIVMGVTWIVDIISWVVGGPQYIWYATDIMNALQGVFIFIVVGCQPQVWAAVKRLWCFKKLPWCFRELPSETGNVRSSSSHATPSIVNDHSTTKPVSETLC
nr:PREDICTED: probable G-protein coupled receptor Mth-like 1 isoform X2 [Bemisia tabaci]